MKKILIPILAISLVTLFFVGLDFVTRSSEAPTTAPSNDADSHAIDYTVPVEASSIARMTIYTPDGMKIDTTTSTDASKLITALHTMKFRTTSEDPGYMLGLLGYKIVF